MTPYNHNIAPRDGAAHNAESYFANSQLRLSEANLQLSTSNWDVAHHVINDMFGQHRERGVTLAPASAPTRIYKADLGGLTVTMLSYGRDIIIEPFDFGSLLMITTVLRGSLQLVTDRSVVSGGPGATMLVTPCDRPIYHYKADTELLKLHVDALQLESACWHMLGRRGTDKLRFHVEMVGGSILRRWLALLNYIISTIESDVPNGAQLFASALEMLHLTLLTGQPHNYSQQLSAINQVIAPRQWHRAVAFMEEYLCAAVTLTQIAEAAGCSVRSLTRAFREFGDTTPMRHLLELRLQHVHRELQKSMIPHRNITVTALHWGFRHLGEFNRQYQARFGETPSETRCRKRPLAA